MRWMVLAIAAVCGIRGAQSAETAQERGKRVVMEALQALGGDAYLKMEDRVESGRAYSFHDNRLSGLSIAKVYTRYLVQPSVPEAGKVYVRERAGYGKDEFQKFLFTDDGAWEMTFRGAQELPDERIALWKDGLRRNVLYILHNRLKEPGLAFYSQGTDRWENKPVEIVEITDNDNNTVTVYFDQLSKLPVRQVYRRRNQEYKDFDTEVTLFGNYRDVGGGVKWPTQTRRDRNGSKIFEMFSESVEINKGLRDDLFTLPATLKVIPKKGK